MENEVDVDGFVDPHGLWDHVFTTLFHGRPDDLDVGTRMAMIQNLQNEFNRFYLATGVSHGQPCAGRRRKVRDESGNEVFDWANQHRCKSALCPSCFFANQSNCLAYVKEMAPRWPYLYLRQTSVMPCHGKTPAALYKRFVATDTRYHLLAWTVAFESDETSFEEVEDLEEGGYAYPIRYKLMGVFGAAKPVREFGVLRPTGNPDPLQKSIELATEVIDWETKENVGEILRTEVYEVEYACDQWLENLGHPMLHTRHSSFQDAVGWSKWTLSRAFQRGQVSSQPPKPPEKAD